MKKKLVLVSANRFTVPYPVYPIGISYLFSYLKKKLPDFEFFQFDFNLQSDADFVALLKDQQPDYIGISLRNIDDNNIYEKGSFIDQYREITQMARDYSKAVIVVGGAGFSIYPKYLFDYLKPDFGIKGEGEQSLFELIKCLENKADYSHIQGLVFNNTHEKKVNSRKTFINNLELEFNTEALDFYWKNSGMLNIQTKRGCPYHCIYCSYPIIEGATIRTLDTDMIVDTLKDLYFNKKINYVFFTDSIFNINDAFNYELAEKIIKSGIKMNWGAYFAPNRLDEKMLVKLKASGLTHIEFGTDSLSDTQLKNYNKSFTFKDILEKSELCNKIHVFFAHFLILGGYGETEATLNETFENSKKITNTVFFPYVGMRIYPGTRLFDIAVEEKKIGRDDDLLKPVYYISDQIDISNLKERAATTGRTWIFPDENRSDFIAMLRARNRKGPLWEHLRDNRDK